MSKTPPKSKQVPGQDEMPRAKRWLGMATGAARRQPPRITPVRGTGSHLSDARLPVPSESAQLEKPKYKSQEVWKAPTIVWKKPPLWQRALVRMGFATWVIVAGVVSSLLAWLIVWKFSLFK